MLVTPSALLYATGGAAYGSLSATVTVTTLTPLGLPVSVSGTGENSKFGWTIGGGIKSKFGSNWSGKLEYLYMDLGTVTAPNRRRHWPHRCRSHPEHARHGQYLPRRHQLQLLGRRPVVARY